MATTTPATDGQAHAGAPDAREPLPATYITHGGGPCFFMDWDPPDAWDELRAALEAIVPGLPRRPRAILVVTAHWESPEFAIASGPAPELIYDYGGFPPHTYQLTHPAPATRTWPPESPACSRGRGSPIASTRTTAGTTACSSP